MPAPLHHRPNPVPGSGVMAKVPGGSTRLKERKKEEHEKPSRLNQPKGGIPRVDYAFLDYAGHPVMHRGTDRSAEGLEMCSMSGNQRRGNRGISSTSRARTPWKWRCFDHGSNSLF